MTVHLLVEGPSELAFFETWARRLLKGCELTIHAHRGRGRLPSDLASRPDPKHHGLLDQLPAKLRGFAQSLGPGDAVVVLVDADADSPGEFAAAIENAARSIAPTLRVYVHLAIEETEAFYLGDLRAIERVYPRADMSAARRRVPDSICGTWELFGRVIHDGGGNKTSWAEAMGPAVTVRAEQSRSPSFRTLVAGLRDVVSAMPKKPLDRRRHHPIRTSSEPGRRR